MLLLLSHADVSLVVVTGSRVDVILDRTPFYAESGGQVGDHGLLCAVGDTATVLDVLDVQKAAGRQLFVHSAQLQSGKLSVGQEVSMLFAMATCMLVSCVVSLVVINCLFVLVYACVSPDKFKKTHQLCATAGDCCCGCYIAATRACPSYCNTPLAISTETGAWTRHLPARLVS